MDGTEAKPAKDWREVERERAERRERRWRKFAPYFLVLCVVFFAATMVMLMMYPREMISWLDVVASFLNLAWAIMWYRRAKRDARAGADKPPQRAA